MDYPVFIIDQLPQQLQALRKSRRWSQTELAKRLGVTQARVATIERNPSVVSLGQFFEILQLMDVQLVLRDLQTSDASAEGELKQSGAVSTQAPPNRPKPPGVDTDYTPKGEW
jgi:HTH-type transcriptional regulator/antitoxin HipB